MSERRMPREGIPSKHSINEGLVEHNQSRNEHEERKKAEQEYGTDKYWEKLQKQHDQEERVFSKAGWHALNCQHPFYREMAGEPEGTRVTIASTPTDSPTPGLDWWFIEGDKPVPDDWKTSRSVMEVKDGRWEYVVQERSGEEGQEQS